MPRLHVVDHPLLARHLTVLRDVRTSHEGFRAALGRAGTILAYEAMRELPVASCAVETPLEPFDGTRLAGEVVVVAILRAGLGLVDGFLGAVPEARVGHLGMRRNESTLRPEGYYESLPAELRDPFASVFLVDPMLATGGSALRAIARMREAGAGAIALVCLVAAPEGVRAVHEAHPDVPIVVAALDRGLDERGFIRPGLGDAGDRIFGTG